MSVIWHGVRDALLMAWEVWWALVIGFAISAIVQAWVPRERVQRALGEGGPAALTRATALGAASSSCSYAAVAIARSLFAKGASAASALAFQFASTNLVWELGLVLWVLIGWQFTVAEYVGGIAMIVLMSASLRLFVSRDVEEAARAHAEAADPRSPASGRRLGGPELARPAHLGPGVLRRRSQLPRRLADAVCSVGNMPLAAVLWSGGIGFSGVLAFLFADLIVLPILAIYRKYYGTAFTVRITALMTATMIVAALIVAGVFDLLGLIPSGARPSRADIFGAVHVDYKLALNVLGTVVFAALLWLTARRGETDPVCGMKVDRAKAVTRPNGGGTTYFCSARCAGEFDRATGEDHPRPAVR